ncbi:unnamed protein product, partial [Brassica oleracea var. botrytis]
VRNGAGRSLTSARSNKQLQLLAFVSTLALTDASDVPHWYVNGIRIVTRITSLLVSSVDSNLHTAPNSWNATLTWLPTAHSDRYVRFALLQGWQSAIYGIWFERNTRFHSGLTHSLDVVTRNSLRIVIDKCYAMCSLGSALGSLLLQIWHPP